MLRSNYPEIIFEVTLLIFLWAGYYDLANQRNFCEWRIWVSIVLAEGVLRSGHTIPRGVGAQVCDRS